MEESELEEWFESKKAELEKSSLKAMMKARDREPIRKKFDNAYKSLLHQYQQKQLTLYKSQRRKAALQKPIHQLESAVREKKKKFRDFFVRRHKEFQKWRFNRKLHKLMRNTKGY